MLLGELFDHPPVAIPSPPGADEGGAFQLGEHAGHVERTASDVFLGFLPLPEHDVDQGFAETENGWGARQFHGRLLRCGRHYLSNPSLASMSSSGIPFVSGMIFRTQNSCPHMQTKKKLKAVPPPQASISGGKA